MTQLIRIGTRGSHLALWQANEVAKKLAEIGYRSEIVTVKTTGDKRQNVSLASVGGKGVFIKELEEALERGEIDVAVHSLKDVPSIVPERFVLAGFLKRADPRDAWVHLERIPISELPAGAVIGTSAPRRRAQLIERFPQLKIEPIRGNVETRINKARGGLYDGIVLASAGLTRLGRDSDITSYFSIEEMVPAAGQGIIVIEAVADRSDAREAAGAINHGPSELAALCERGVLQKFGEQLDCYSAVAVHAALSKDEIAIHAFFGDYDGTRSIRATQRGRDPQKVIGAVYEELVSKGALSFRASARNPQHYDAGDPSPSLRLGMTSERVFLVGAGPGDPRLLTLRAAELIATADFVALDALVSKEIASRIPTKAEVVYVGKRARAHTLSQEKINRLLIEEAKKGKRVVRLKGGDPFVFGRGGEEAEEIVAAGVSVEIVPGISSAIAGPAYAGIPVTHRQFSTSLTVVTGHEADESAGIRWAALAQLDGTIVFMMGFANLPLIVQKLTEHGMSGDRPVAVISNGTKPDQRTVTGTLRTIEARVFDAELPTPALIVVGEVVRLREVMNWFESKPLFGKRVVVTRAREQASKLVDLFVDSGANVLQFPTIEVVPPDSYESLDRVIDRKYDLLVFTSVNGVRSYFDRLLEKGNDARALSEARVAAVGENTAAELRGRGIIADLVPEKFISTALLPLLAEDQRGVRTAVIRAAKGSDELIEELRRRGGEVDLGLAYRTRAADENIEELRSLLDSIDVVTFTSGSTVDNFFGKLRPEERTRVLNRAMIASIGPVTTDAIQRYGRGPDIEAEKATIEALHDAVVKAVRRTSSKQPATV